MHVDIIQNYFKLAINLIKKCNSIFPVYFVQFCAYFDRRKKHMRHFFTTAEKQVDSNIFWKFTKADKYLCKMIRKIYKLVESVV